MFESSISPLISIIMPNYNRGNFIAETIDSIQKQTYANWELIILDDGSDDETGEIISGINDSRIQFYREGKTGLDKLRNKGLHRAKGSLIAFMDSDDLWAETKLEKQLKAFEDIPEAAFCLTGGYNFTRRNEPLDFFYKPKSGSASGNLFISFFRSELSAFPSALIFKKECLITAGYFKETRLAHVDFILSLAKQFTGVILYEPLTYRRLHNSNYSSLHSEKRHQDGLALIRSYKAELPKEIYRDCLFRSYIHFGEECLRHSKRKAAAVQFLQAWKYKWFSIIPVKKISKTILDFS